MFHEGACSDTMEHDGRLMLDLNYRSLEDAARRLPGAGRAPALRVVGGGTYGGSASFREEPAFERPLNVYG